MSANNKVTYRGLRILTGCVLASLSMQCQPANGDIYYPFFSDSDGLVLVGDATIHSERGTRLRLTPSIRSSRGSCWFEAKQRIENGFEMECSIQITARTGLGGQLGADGFAFVVQNSAVSALGAQGHAMGYGIDDLHSDRAGIANCVAIEFDTWENGDFLDLSPSHVSVQTRGVLENHPDHQYSLGAAPIADIDDGGIHSIRVSYVSGELAVYIDAGADTEPVLSVPIEIGDVINLDDGKAWVGFTAGTGGASQNHDILSWSFTESVEPRPTILPDLRYDRDMQTISIRFVDIGTDYIVHIGDDTSAADHSIFVGPGNGVVDRSTVGEIEFEFIDELSEHVKFFWIGID